MESPLSGALTRPVAATLAVLSASFSNEPRLKKRSYRPARPGVGRTARAYVVCSQVPLPGKAKLMAPTRVYGEDGPAPARRTEIRSLPAAELVTKSRLPA